MNDRLLGIVNRVSGALIIIFGAVVLVRVACSFLL